MLHIFVYITQFVVSCHAARENKYTNHFSLNINDKIQLDTL